MSRGPGRVMRGVEAALASASSEGVTYADLARGVYATSAPSRSQLSAIARAAKRLNEQGRAQMLLDGRITRVARPLPWDEGVAERVEAAIASMRAQRRISTTSWVI